MEFEPNEELAAKVRRTADDFVAMVRDRFNVTLDYSDGSMKLVDRIADSMHRSLPPEEERDEAFERTLEGYSDQVGAYVGEVIRRRVGGTWGHGVDEGERFEALYTSGGTLLWPAGRAYKRIVEGGADDLWEYVQLFVPSGRAADLRLYHPDDDAAKRLEGFRIDDAGRL